MPLEAITDQEFISIMKANQKTHHMHLANATDINKLIISLARRIKQLELQLDMHLEGHR